MKNLRKIALLLLALLLLASTALAEKPTQDRAGNPITLPDNISKIVSLAPATTQVLDSLGVKDKLVAVDTQSPLYVEGVKDLPQFDMMAPDVEQIASLEPDIVFTAGMSYLEGNPFAPLTDMGIAVVDIPSSTSIEAVGKDVVFTAACLGLEEEGQKLADDMMAKIDALAAKAEGVAEKKTVFFEIGALPYLYSFGSDTFLHEMIERLGATNVMGAQTSWLSVSEEDAVSANPDVILTSVNYIDNPVEEILTRPGWENVTAVKNGQVFYIDNGASSLPNHHIVKAMEEMAAAIYPEIFADK